MNDGGRVFSGLKRVRSGNICMIVERLKRRNVRVGLFIVFAIVFGPGSYYARLMYQCRRANPGWREPSSWDFKDFRKLFFSEKLSWRSLHNSSPLFFSVDTWLLKPRACNVCDELATRQKSTEKAELLFDLLKIESGEISSFESYAFRFALIEIIANEQCGKITSEQKIEIKKRIRNVFELIFFKDGLVILEDDIFHPGWRVSLLDCILWACVELEFYEMVPDLEILHTLFSDLQNNPDKMDPKFSQFRLEHMAEAISVLKSRSKSELQFFEVETHLWSARYY